LYRAEQGLTLIEMLVAVGTMGLVAVIVASLFAQGMHTYSAGQAAGLVIADMRFAVEQVATRLREARPGSVAVADAGRQITFQVWDRSISNWITLTYRLSGQDIQLNSQPMATYVQTLQFALTDAGRAVTITATTVSSVPGARPGTGLPFTFTTRAVLRN
jgi:Tfp pilus assembly protein FimT